jgi:geranylgeranyl diphosphate synthase type II
MQSYQKAIESALELHLPQCRRLAARPLDDAVRYAIFPGGKRIRPLLTLLGAGVFGAELQAALPAACAVEFIHTSSLVFDDLPCMDDAHIRRGIPVVHAVFGEEVALLAGLALLNQSYAIFGQTPALMREATRCIGVDGMIGGQALDLVPEEDADASAADREQRLAERNRKTSAMMRLALTAGALACGATEDEVAVLGAAGQSLGEAFQMADDLLDARRSSEHTGKNAGQDRRHKRPNYGGVDEHAMLAQVRSMVVASGAALTEAYGRERIAALMAFLHAMFGKLTAEEQAPVRTA